MLPHPLGSVAGAFLLAFPALFSIVNPFGSALTFGQVTVDRNRQDRQLLARRISMNSVAMLLGSLWIGSYVLNFLGISLGALRIAGGLIVASRAWELLSAPEQRTARKEGEAAPTVHQPVEEIAFFPLTMPFTTGPGTIAVAITLGSERPVYGSGLLAFFIGMSLAATAVAICVWVTYRSADGIMKVLGETGTRIVTRLVAFLLLCVGVQILVNGISDLIHQFVMHKPA